MVFKVEERLAMLQLLPPSGNSLTYGIVEALKTKCALSEEDIQDVELVELPGGNVRWQRDKDHGKEIAIGPKATAVIAGLLKKMQQQEELNPNTFLLYKLFVDDEPASLED